MVLTRGTNRFSVLAEESSDIKSLQSLRKMTIKRQLIPLAKSLNITGISKKKKEDLCLIIADALGLERKDEQVEVETTHTSLTMTMTRSRSKRAMSSQKASSVKRQGHKNQDRFAQVMSGVKSNDHTGKIDIRVDEKTYSLKKECKRIQFALYTITSRRWRNTSEMSSLCKACLNVLPRTFDEYKRDATKFKSLIANQMNSLNDACQHKSRLKELLEIFIRGRSNEVRYVVFNFKGEDYIFQADEMIDTIVQNTQTRTSSKRGSDTLSSQKVVIRNAHNIIELEIRKSSRTHYKEFLCIANRDKLLNLLLKFITTKDYYKDKILLMGKARQQHGVIDEAGR